MVAGDEALSDESRVTGPLDRLYGIDGRRKIASSHVVVVGIGGVGSWVAEALARSGVGSISLIDMDHVAPSNLNRQVHALTSTIGRSKVLAMQDRIASFQTNCKVHVIDDFVTFENWPKIMSLSDADGPDAVIDACDDYRAKLTMARWSMSSDCEFVSVGAAGGKKLAHEVRLGDLSEVTHDPLLAKIRYALRREHGAKRKGRIGVTCVSSSEQITTLGPQVDGGGVGAGAALSCHGYGSTVAVTATFGMCAAGWVLNLLSKNKRMQG